MLLLTIRVYPALAGNISDAHAAAVIIDAEREGQLPVRVIGELVQVLNRAGWRCGRAFPPAGILALIDSHLRPGQPTTASATMTE